MTEINIIRYKREVSGGADAFREKLEGLPKGIEKGKIRIRIESYRELNKCLALKTRISNTEHS